MNRKHAKYIAPFVAGYGKGRDLQGRQSNPTGSWINMTDPIFADPDIEYRFKPKPEVVWGNKRTDADTIYTHSNKDHAINTAKHSGFEYEYIARRFVSEE